MQSTGHIAPILRLSVAGALIAGLGYAEDPVSFVTRQLGKPYRSDARAIGPDAFDCSGLTKAAYDQAGISLPHHAASQGTLGSPVQGSLEPGDLLFFDSGSTQGTVAHVGILEQGVTMIHAHSSYGVRRDDYTDSYWRRHFLFARRLSEGERLDSADTPRVAMRVQPRIGQHVYVRPQPRFKRISSVRRRHIGGTVGRRHLTRSRAHKARNGRTARRAGRSLRKKHSTRRR